MVYLRELGSASIDTKLGLNLCTRNRRGLWEGRDERLGVTADPVLLNISNNSRRATGIDDGVPTH